MKYEVNAYTTKYYHKDLNEDAILVNDCVISDGFYQRKCDLDEFIYAVCDGVSGSDKGYYASTYVLQSLINSNYTNKDELRHVLYDINNNLKQVGEKINSNDMSTTLACLYFNEAMNIFSVGDSRVYKVKNGVVTQLTVDDTVANQLFKDGIISEKEIETHPKKNVLLNFFGNSDDQFSVQKYVDEDFENATYFIMSDGISDYIPKERIETLMLTNCDGIDILRILVGEAINNNSSDDISIIVLEVM